MRNIVPYLLAFMLLVCLVLLSFPTKIQAAQSFGVHVLKPEEIDQVIELLGPIPKNDDWFVVTIPITLDDIVQDGARGRWQAFFDKAREHHIQPIVRVATRFENGAWKKPTRKNITDMSTFLSSLNWPKNDERLVIFFNETNHKAEWGGDIQPEEYAHAMYFAAQWFHSESDGYTVLPAGMDLAAPNGPTTMEAFAYLDRVFNAEPELLGLIDGWVSHSYPNPAFSAPPQANGKNSLRGYQHELAYLQKRTDRAFPVYITETGWIDSRSTGASLQRYYAYAVEHIWSDDRIVAVTPFVLQGSPGPFSGFSFLDANGKPTRQYIAYQKAVKESRE